jgi:hypothetical protein
MVEVWGHAVSRMDGVHEMLGMEAAAQLWEVEAALEFLSIENISSNE